MNLEDRLDALRGDLEKDPVLGKYPDFIDSVIEKCRTQGGRISDDTLATLVTEEAATWEWETHKEGLMGRPGKEDNLDGLEEQRRRRIFRKELIAEVDKVKQRENTLTYADLIKATDLLKGKKS